jgi:hypothetical protein
MRILMSVECHILRTLIHSFLMSHQMVPVFVTEFGNLKIFITVVTIHTTFFDVNKVCSLPTPFVFCFV